MWSSRSRFSLTTLLFPNFWLFLNYHIHSAIAQCETGLEATCVWHHSANSALQWQQKSDSGESWVELVDCKWPQCGIGQIESPWLPARGSKATATLRYKVYGTSRVYFRLQLKLEDDLSPRLLFSKNGNYAYGYPEEWSTKDVTLPPTHTNYQLLIKAYVPYKEAMVSIKGISLDRNHVITIYPTQYVPDIEESDYSSTVYPTNFMPEMEESGDSSPGTRNDYDYFPDDEDDDEIERRFQALEVQNFIGEEDLTKGFTTVVKPQLCMYR